jgi:tRNA(adenine34) deaminase
MSTADREQTMREALSLAEDAASQGEIPVGCVITDSGGRIIGRGRNRREETHDATAHAELEAIREACEALGDWRLEGCSLFVTLEPCPMCAGAIALSGIKRVIYAASDKKYGCCGSVYRLTEDPAFDRYCRADGGLLANKSERLLNSCFQSMRK